jgi:hypothetical protein
LKETIFFPGLTNLKGFKIGEYDLLREAFKIQGKNGKNSKWG